ncbi:MAG: GDP-L-fucose synthase [Bacteroidetes bacterium HGW-Bacteroidetes-17]|jgi:GDP-L-fucose synthase|nr:MAG: GDP-L-fucose synthase [Bacteroidetes bacterium HGW-Bacteroidetes-17]
MHKDAKIYIAGHNGLVGSAILKNLHEKGYFNIIVRDSSELNLIDQNATANFFKDEKPEYVFLAAAKVGGIVANNTYRADFIYENLMIQNNVIHNAWKFGVKKLLFLGSTCIYPKEATQPMKETELLTGPLEYTNEPYAIAKIAGIKMCESYNLQYGTNFISVMPTNLYGPNDNFDLEKSHVLPALVRKVMLGKFLENDEWNSIRKDLHNNPIEGIDGASSQNDIVAILTKYGIKFDQEKKEVNVEIWGTGTPKREFMWSEEMADACVHIMEKVNFNDLYSVKSTQNSEIRNTHINIGTGEEISISELVELIKKLIGFKGDFQFNPGKPDGTMRKVTNISKLHKLGWTHEISLEEGIKMLIGLQYKR